MAGPVSGFVEGFEGSHTVAQLGLELKQQGDLILGRATVVPEICQTNVDTLRSSIVLTWADILIGTAAGQAMSPRIPLTLDLDVQMIRRIPAGSVVLCEASLIRSGRTVTVTDCWFKDESDGSPVAFASGTFVPSPDPTAVFPGGFPIPTWTSSTISEPLVDHLACCTLAPGRVEMPRREGGLNAVGAMQGGLMTVAVEEAVLSLHNDTAAIVSLGVRYLRPVMQGPAVATASSVGAVHTVRLTDKATGKLCLFSTIRTDSRS